MDFLGLFDPSEEDSDVGSSSGSLGSAGMSSPDSSSPESGLEESSSSELEQLPDQLPPEPQLGNIEYKLKLVSPSKHRFQHLVTQMKWRLREGQGEAIYEIGVEDSGLMTGLEPAEMTASLTTLHRMAAELGAAVTVLRERRVPAAPGGPERCVSEVLVRKVPDDIHSVDLRLAVLGNADVGKSTLLGVLTYGELDNGRGRSRLNIFRHLHEIRTGRTSSISHEILGFDSEGNTVDYSASPTAEEICEQSTKLVTFIDLAGHQKYLKTTVLGLTGYSPHHAMLVVSANSGIAGTTQEHVGLALALKVPMFIVVTKIDLTSAATLRHTLAALEAMVRGPGCGKQPLRVVDETSAAEAAAAPPDTVPVFSVSSVTGAGLPLLKKYLHALSPSTGATERKRLEQQLCEFQIDETYRISETGVVVGGLLTKGIITEGARLSLGPLEDGTFTPVRVSTIHRNRRPSRVVRAGQAASLAIDRDVPGLRRGMVLLAPQARPTACLYFQATVCAFRPQAICRRLQTTVHLGNVRQTAVIEGVFDSTDQLPANKTTSAMFKFYRQPEYVSVGDRLLFRLGRARGYGIGTVTQVFPCRQEEEVM
ncbi:GTP-binding protein 2-like [Amphibalanus amphitrite]|uniref:GTP-binding protein 2-like n=1 Tax=Amphibalanus amphitrite TaxID=1232801 RepID=UPI001C8FBB59|nr:GTP-binding protein 2-like [Amphibalanus amphitrite]XP_043233652.1 GTP-binding protein 2-like [Amphibalanus amphitrite]XP_043233653.1 GTP-binding protein 2-like [Amphibalanus amphitrite]XP_043239133.1 GTP-binding protein 2-like [Amphibalanus amphitrite]XP_043239134.1 GTP-binding protein 2-like [Amphibalanus amphitrite]XP_043239135.1 GTP-binding protein 2-like [Amphibalanus amphitrite]XP_043239136.1 GTP-binding protein 2-like [Amphibalanus amphitrite]